MDEFRSKLGLPRSGEPIIIAEIAQAHDGSLGLAHAHIDAAARAGVDVVKFQTHIADAESTPAEPWRVKFSPQDATRFDYWRRMEFTESQWLGLRDHASELGLGFLSSPFSPEAVDMLKRIGVAGWKVASGEVTNLPLIEMMASTGQPILLSSGMSSFEELDDAVGVAARHGAPLALFQCTTMYPTPADRVGLNVIAQLRERYDCPVGLSDHSATIFAGLAAIALGASLVEVHLTLSRDMFGPDVPASLTVDELGQLVAGSRFISEALRSEVDKSTLATDLIDLRTTFGKSVVAARDLEAGETVLLEDLALKKPGSGLPVSAMAGLVGRVVARDLPRNTVIRHVDLRSAE